MLNELNKLGTQASLDDVEVSHNSLPGLHPAWSLSQLWTLMTQVQAWAGYVGEGEVAAAGTQASLDDVEVSEQSS